MQADQTPPVIPGPSPDAVVIAVSPTVASPDHPVFFYRDPNDRLRLLAYDWNGVLRGQVIVSASGPYGVYPSADGTMILLTGATVVSGGRSLGQINNGMWAGDNAHVCVFLNTLGGPGAPRIRSVSANELEGTDTPGSLFYQTVGGQSRRILDYGSFSDHGGPAVLACSAKTDRAVVVQTFVAQASNLQMVRLSDGHIIYQRPGASLSQPGGLVASEDGTLLAEGSTASGWSGQGQDSFVVYRIPSNQVVARIAGGGAVAFSADDTRVLTVQYLNGGNQSGRYQVIDLATLKPLWSAVMSPGTVLARPGSGDFLVASRTWEPSRSRPNSNDPFEDVWLVPAAGPARLLLEHASPLA